MIRALTLAAFTVAKPAGPWALKTVQKDNVIMTLTEQRIANCREWGRRDYHAGKPNKIPAFLKSPQERRAYAVGYTADKPIIKAETRD
jgi:hypothetical protein